MFEFAGRVGLITGANRGIGACFVDALMAAGASTVYACARNLGDLDWAATKYGDRIVRVELDMSIPEQIQRAIAQCPDVDLLISNAGRGGGGAVHELPDAIARTLFEVHVFGPRQLITGLLPGLIERRGGIILVQSTAALAMSRGGPMYSASKAAGTMMGMGLREAMRVNGVRVSNVHPGFTNTEIIAGYEIAKAEPADVVACALEGWANDEAHVFTDLYARMIHEQLQTQIDFVLSEPVAAGTEVINRYREATGS
jgi:NAD(P)-dependent dehydrogenase (short-subunit alcohol dehydrogenase family)